MLYDSVPGGTGYLHQLLAHDARTLGDVLQMSLEALTKCSCNQDCFATIKVRIPDNQDEKVVAGLVS
jgi:hypothetical protein